MLVTFHRQRIKATEYLGLYVCTHIYPGNLSDCFECRQDFPEAPYWMQKHFSGGLRKLPCFLSTIQPGLQGLQCREVCKYLLNTCYIPISIKAWIQRNGQHKSHSQCKYLHCLLAQHQSPNPGFVWDFALCRPKDRAHQCFCLCGEYGVGERENNNKSKGGKKKKSRYIGGQAQQGAWSSFITEENLY